MAEGGDGRGYGLPDRAAPLPRQWQRQQRQLPPQPASGNATVHQRFHPVAAGTADWRTPTPTPARRTERAILVGLWLLVMLTAVAIGLRLLDLSAVTVKPVDLSARPAVSGASDAARAAAYAAVMDDPLFDDPVPAPPRKPPADASVAAARPGVGLAAAATLSPEKMENPAPAVSAQPAVAGAPCPDALRAMQLCTERRH